MEPTSSLPSSKTVAADTIGGDAKRLRRSSTIEGDENERVAEVFSRSAAETGNALQEIVVAKPSPIGDFKTQKEKISIELVCQTLELELESDVDFPVHNSAKHHLQNINYAAKLSALYRYVAAKYVPLLMKRCIKFPQCESTISAQEFTHILNDLNTLKVFLGSMATNNISDFYASAPGSLKKPLAQAFDDETRYIDALSSFIDRVCVVLNLWRTLCEYPFSSLPQGERNLLATCTFRDLFVLRGNPCVLIIKLINLCLNESTTANLNSSKFSDICSNWCRHLLDEVMDILRSTQTCVDYGDRKQKVFTALQRFKHLVPHIELDDGFLGELLAISNRSAGDFLIRSVLKAPDNIKLVNVLWKYYERNERHSAATKVLEELSSVPNAHQMHLSDRIQYLKHAVNNGHSVGYGISMKNIADTLKVARVQKMILDSLSTKLNRDARSARRRLNQHLYTIDQLYCDFIERFDLSDCKPKIFQYKILQTICIEEKELIDLDDDCLLAIFERLELLDLSVVADVSQRCRAIAQESFRLTKPVVRIPRRVRARKPLLSDKEDEVQIVRRTSSILRNFGSLVTDMAIKCADNWTEKKVFLLLTKHCGESLTSLDLQSLSEKLPDWMRPIIENLKRFVLTNNHIHPYIFAWLSKIEHLRMIQRYSVDPQPLNDFFMLEFEKLERISLRSRATVKCSALAMFLQKHKGLKEVELYLQNDSRDLDLFGDQWLPIEKLGTNLGIKASGFRHLKNLQSLQLSEPSKGLDSGAEEIIEEIAKANIPLKHLHLGGFSEYIEDVCYETKKLVHLESFITDNAETAIDLLPEMLRLNEMKLLFFYAESGPEVFLELNKLVKCFPNLQRLAYDIDLENGVWVFDSNMFIKIAVALEERPDRKPLHLKLRGDCSMKISNELKQRHRHILTVSGVDEIRDSSIIII